MGVAFGKAVEALWSAAVLFILLPRASRGASKGCRFHGVSPARTLTNRY